MIRVNYAALENAQARIHEISKLLDENLGDLKTQLQRMTWTGEDRTAYQQHQNAWDTASDNLNTLLDQIGTEVNAALQRYRESERNRANAWGGPV